MCVFHQKEIYWEIYQVIFQEILALLFHREYHLKIPPLIRVHNHEQNVEEGCLEVWDGNQLQLYLYKGHMASQDPLIVIFRMAYKLFPSNDYMPFLNNGMDASLIQMGCP